MNHKNSQEIRIKLAFEEPFIFERALIFDVLSDPGSARPSRLCTTTQKELGLLLFNISHIIYDI